MHRLPRDRRQAAHAPDLRATPRRKGGLNLAALRTPFGKKRFEKQGNVLIQNSMVDPKLAWEVVQTVDTIDPTSRHYNEKSRLAKTVRFDADGPDGLGRHAPRADGKPSRTPAPTPTAT